MVKGGGAALTREKIVAALAAQFVCIADESKLVQSLGQFPLPVEVIPMATRRVIAQFAAKGGVTEQFPISLAYGADYMSHKTTATPKHYGKTFRKQFETLLNNPETPIATITGWNEWVVGRWACGSLACDCNNAFDKAYGCFLDQFTHEYNRDIEPAKNATGDYYYRLVQSCIKLFRAGKRCTPDNAGELCCQDYAGPK